MRLMGLQVREETDLASKSQQTTLPPYMCLMLVQRKNYTCFWICNVLLPIFIETTSARWLETLNNSAKPMEAKLVVISFPYFFAICIENSSFSRVLVHLFTFSKRFISGTLGVRQKYNLDGTPGCRMAPSTHSFTPSVTNPLLECFGIMESGIRIPSFSDLCTFQLQNS